MSDAATTALGRNRRWPLLVVLVVTGAMVGLLVAAVPSLQVILMAEFVRTLTGADAFGPGFSSGFSDGGDDDGRSFAETEQY